MERITVPYKTVTQIATFEGDWTAEQINNGEAGEPRVETHEAWFEPTDNGPVEVTDPQRVAELEQKIRQTS